MSLPRWVHLGHPGRITDMGGGACGGADGVAAPRLMRAATASHGSAEPMLEALGDLPAQALPRPGGGDTRALWELLASVAAVDLVAARVLEPHLDAVAILDQAGVPVPRGVLGVYASESGGQTPVAHRTRPGHDDGPGAWALGGTKPWCSLAGRCSAAVVTAALPDGGRQAFLVDLRRPGVHTGAGSWPALGLAAIDSGPVTFEAVPALPVGGPSWYLDRPGFAWGGMGVAAVWFGGAVHLYRTLAALAARREPDQFALAALGRVDRLLASVSAQLAAAADAIDAGDLTGTAGELEAYRLRGTVAQVCTEVIDVVGQATGPGPLTGDGDHARAVADLQVYVRQHHAGRDDARLGTLILTAARP
ncbi:MULTISPECIES: acyl-CoA hydrolase [Citricoccus]|uniref:acyl-CoA hydrolase n=1 Tax=Citricoccus TaxID=169133 RepID=UPI000255F723|nr:acyl-CoA hydrolase [Citricoccus sp. CH26A]